MFFGIQMTVAIIKMSQWKTYCFPKFRYEQVAMAITLKPYETSRKFLRVNNKGSWNNFDNSKDKLFKVRPVLDLVRNNCTKTEPENSHSIDEQIIPTKTKRSGGVKQYNPKRIHEWGFKNKVRLGQSGIMYDLFMYGKKHSAGAETYGAEKSVFQLLEEALKNKNYQVFFDNWLTTLHFLSNSNPWVFYQLQHCTLIV